MSGLHKVKSTVLAACRQMLVPLVRLMLKSGISFAEFTEIAKRTFVAVCADEFVGGNVQASSGRVGIVCGIPRAEVERIRADESQLDLGEGGIWQLVKVLVGWHEDKDFLGPYGMPRVLHFEVDPFGSPTFCDLVNKHSPELIPLSALRTLELAGAVVRASEHAPIQVTRRELGFVSQDAQMVDFFARAIRGFIDTSVHNLTCKPNEKFFLRWVIADHGIRREDWNVFSDMVRDRLDPVLQELDAKFASFEFPAASDEDSLAVGVGFYTFRDPVHESSADRGGVAR